MQLDVHMKGNMAAYAWLTLMGTIQQLFMIMSKSFRKHEIRKVRKASTSFDVEARSFLKIARPGWGEIKRRGVNNDGECI